MALDLGELVAKLRMDMREWNKNHKDAEAQFKGFAKKLGTMAKAAGAAIAVGIGGALLTQIPGMISAASDLGETTSKVGVIFGKASKDIEAFGDRAAEKLGQSKKEAMDAAATFAIYGKQAGLAGEHLTDFSTDLVTLASDMASFSNTSPQEAIEAIGSALRGESDPIEKYGVLLNESVIQQQALKMGIIKTTKDALTPQQRVVAASAAIFAQTKAAQGDFARTSGGLANQTRILTAKFENTKAELGAGLLPIMIKVVGWLSKAVEYVKANHDWLVPLAAVVGTVAGALWLIVTVVKAWTAVQWALNAALDANPIGLIVLAIAALVAGFIWAYKNVSWFHKLVDTAFRGFKIIVHAVVSWIVGTAWPWLQKAWKGIAAGAVWLWHNVMEPVGRGIIGVVKWIAGAAVWLWHGIEAVGRGIGAAFRFVADIAMWLWNHAIKPMAAGIGAAIGFVVRILRSWAALFTWIAGKVIGPALGFITWAFGLVAGAAMWVWNNGIKPAWNAIVAATKWLGSVFVWLYQNAILPTWNAIVGAIRWVGQAFTWLYQNIVKPAIGGIASAALWVYAKVLLPVFTFIMGIVHKVGNTFKSVFGAIKNWIVGGFKGAVGVAKGAINGLIDLVNSAVGFINRNLVDGLNKVPGVDFPHIPTLPRLAMGGKVSPRGGGTPVMMGDGGQVEYGVPRDEMRSIIREAVNAGGGGGELRELTLILHDTSTNRRTRHTARVQGNKAVALVGAV